MQIKAALHSVEQNLFQAGVASPRLNAEILTMFVMERDRSFLYAHPENELTPEQIERLNFAISERSRGVPAQYITGHQEFWGLDFLVNPSVLIPRPETEHVVETVLDLARRQTHPHIVDVGTGSGCIAIALAKELPSAEIIATDISAPALETAKANAAHNGLSGRISFRVADLLQDREPNSFDFVVSNPPYVGESEEDQVQLEVRKFEPRGAVFSGPTGIEVIARLAPQARSVLKPGGGLVIEISASIAERVRSLLSDWVEMEIANDLQGIPRVVRARKPSESTTP